MKLVINGEERAFDQVRTLAELVESMGLKSDRVAIEHNRGIVPRAEWAQTVVQDGDRLEVVHFVGGGRT